MGKSRRAWRARTGFAPHGVYAAEPGRLLHAARPAAEAALLAAVALGCAQLGVSALSATTAHSSAPDAGAGAQPTTLIAAAPVRSPFSPTANLAEPNGSSLLATLRVSGVRMADDGAQSGAIFVIDGQDQRAFSVGQDVAPGMRLSAVATDHITVAYDGGERQVAVDQAPQRFSFARALMGETQSAPAPAEVRFLSDAPDAAPAVAAAAPPTPFTANTQAPAAIVAAPAAHAPARAEGAPAMETWLAATLARVETSGAGWRIVGPLPQAAAAAGLQSGDLVVAINGYGPERSAEAAGAAAQGGVRLDVVRDGAAVSVTLGDDRRT
ncbi:MAG: hypothetical protein GC206_07235 [Alphaproteobacteria bacterium]|nr:hypothetical protein [Alphaproteobacteria bacterium]